MWCNSPRLVKHCARPLQQACRLGCRQEGHLEQYSVLRWGPWKQAQQHLYQEGCRLHWASRWARQTQGQRGQAQHLHLQGYEQHLARRYVHRLALHSSCFVHHLARHCSQHSAPYLDRHFDWACVMETVIGLVCPQMVSHVLARASDQGDDLPYRQSTVHPTNQAPLMARRRVHYHQDNSHLMGRNRGPPPKPPVASHPLLKA
mmetsp:Transcript_39174/g.100085  ORF Transcript_39174/g.100085 Transcript_39174/m.100085 type:complete len:203 (+) Transcript_39174:3035-3643(+)